MTSLGLAALRLGLSAVFVAHGLHKLFGFFADPGVGSGGLRSTADYFSALGLEPGLPLAILVGVTQLLAGSLVGVGFLTRWAALALLGEVAFGIWKAHIQWGFFLNWTGEAGRSHGLEYSVVLAGALVCLAFAGGGEWSIDGWRTRTAESRAAGRARLRGKV
jgi:putative oxidoreductase